MEPGTAFTYHPSDGLWIVISDLIGESDRVLAVQTSDTEVGKEAGLVLTTEDHPYLQKPCWVDFTSTTEVSTTRLNQSVTQGRVVFRGLCRPTITQRIWSEAAHSKRLAKNFVALLRNQGKIN
jgi:hypothetical protein